MKLFKFFAIALLLSGCDSEDRATRLRSQIDEQNIRIQSLANVTEYLMDKEKFDAECKELADFRDDKFSIYSYKVDRITVVHCVSADGHGYHLDDMPKAIAYEKAKEYDKMKDKGCVQHCLGGY